MEISDLINLGLTEGESKVYLALLRIGTSTVGKIVKEAGVSNSKVYDILDRLNKKGLIGIALFNNKKQFEPKDPSRLKELIEIKEKEILKEKQGINEVVLKLNALKKYSEPLQEAEILQGINGIKTAIEAMLSPQSKGNFFYILGAPVEANEVLGAYFQDWHIRRAKKKVLCRLLYERDAEKWALRRSKTPLTEIKFLPRDIKAPTLVDITKEYVAIIIFGDRPLCFLIKNKKVAEGYKKYFELLWKIAKK